jgi:predicted RNA-binding Zn-ribbon protein involved in translation (DUF1610 family)
MEQEVKFKCPICGKEWVEMQEEDDEWFGLATLITLCTECGDKEIKRMIQEWGL